MATYLFHAVHGMKLFEDDGEAADLVGRDGWADSPADLDEPQADEPQKADIDALRHEAESLGIKVDKRWREDRLAEEIEKRKGA